jgi:hypothetical protein
LKERALRFKSRISLRQARSKIIDFGLFGDHSVNPRPKTGQEVAKFFLARGANPDRIAEECRDYARPVPYFENLVGGRWMIEAEGQSSVTFINKESNEEMVFKGDAGEFVGSSYVGLFKLACEARDRAVLGCSQMEMIASYDHGVASIEGFINGRAHIWNIQHPKERLEDSKARKISFDDKLSVWVPQMLGRRLDISNNRWEVFWRIRRLRNDEAAHPKAMQYGTTLRGLAKRIDRFRSGIAGVLFQLHIEFVVPIPALLINAVHMPEVQIVEVAQAGR